MFGDRHSWFGKNIKKFGDRRSRVGKKFGKSIKKFGDRYPRFGKKFGESIK